MAAINSGAAGIGKMFSPQSMAIAIGAVAPALDAYIESNKVDDAKANQLRESIKANVIMVSVLKYFIIFIVANGVVSYFGHNFIEHIQAFLL